MTCRLLCRCSKAFTICNKKSPLINKWGLHNHPSWDLKWAEHLVFILHIILFKAFRGNPLRRRSFPGCPRGWSCPSRSPACRTYRGRCPSAPCRSRRRPGNRQSSLERNQEKQQQSNGPDSKQTGRDRFFQCFSHSEEILNIQSLLLEVICSQKSSEVFFITGLFIISAHWGDEFCSMSTMNGGIVDHVDVISRNHLTTDWSLISKHKKRKKLQK